VAYAGEVEVERGLEGKILGDEMDGAGEVLWGLSIEAL
jgi:hypothetical protein